MIRKILNYMLRAADYNLVKTRGDVLYDAYLNNTNRILELEAERDYLDAKCAELEAEKEQVCEYIGEYGGYDEHGDTIFFSKKTGCSDEHIQKIVVPDHQFCPNCGKRIVYKDGE